MKLWKHRATLVALFVFLGASGVFADDSYLAQSRLDPIALLAPPPLPDSAEQKADLDTVERVDRGRTDEDLAAARKEESFDAFYFAKVIGKNFERSRLPITAAFLNKVQRAESAKVGVAKNYWKRPRPYTFDNSLLDGHPESSASYPSGHSTGATVDALILADLFPAKREAILELGRNIGWRRLIIGKHFATDVYAGRVLAQAIVRELKANADYQHDFAAAQAEINAAAGAQ